jgi:hypothetical protein
MLCRYAREEGTGYERPAMKWQCASVAVHVWPKKCRKGEECERVVESVDQVMVFPSHGDPYVRIISREMTPCVVRAADDDHAPSTSKSERAMMP